MTDQDDRTPHEILQCLEWLSTPRATIQGTEDSDLVAALELAHQALLAAQMRFNGHDLAEPDNFRERLRKARDVLCESREKRDERILDVLEWASKQGRSDSATMTVLDTVKSCIAGGVYPKPSQEHGQRFDMSLTADELREFLRNDTVTPSVGPSRQNELELSSECIAAWCDDRGKWTALYRLMAALGDSPTSPGAFKQRFLRASTRRA